MKTIKLPLFWKFAITIVLLVIVFGVINMFILWESVYKSFEKEIQKRSLVLSKIIAEKAINPIVYEDDVNLYKILGNMMRSDTSIAYIFLTNERGEVIAKTFDFNIPISLRKANNIVDGKYNIEQLKADNYKYGNIVDIAYPIMEGHVGVVRLGLVEDSITNELKEARDNLLFMILLFLIIGLIGAFGFSYLITSPIKYISNQAQQVNLDTLNGEIKDPQTPRYKRIFNIYFSDELDILSSKFQKMLIRLRSNYKELQETRNSFIQAEKMAAIGTLAAGIGHEINNPISGIKNCLIRISKQPQNIEQTINYVKLIQDATERVENVTQHLLDFSRKQDHIFNTVNLSETLNDAISLVNYKITKSKITINKAYKDNLFIYGNNYHLEQVFLNLLLNSIDAIKEMYIKDPHYNGIISISTKKEKEKILIQFEDNGVGINAKNKRKLFDPFYTTKEAGKGTGLGLYVSFNIIKEHNGTIYYEGDKINKRTIFTIELDELNNGIYEGSCC